MPDYTDCVIHGDNDQEELFAQGPEEMRDYIDTQKIQETRQNYASGDVGHQFFKV